MSDTLVITEVSTEVIEIELQPSPVVEIVEVAAEVLEIAVEGPQGPPGPQGPVGPPGADATYTHTQGAPSASWSITHGLGKYPSVTVVDSSGSEVEGDVTYLSNAQVLVSFSAPFSGVAYLN